MKVKNIYTSVACNRTTESADWGKNGLIVFGACNAISILNPKFNGNSAKIIYTFVEHTKRVNTVKWIHHYSGMDNNAEIAFISGSDDGRAIVWDISEIDNPKLAICSGHESGVNAVATISVNNSLIIATASADSTIKIWRKSDNENICECIQTILLKTGFSFAISLSILPSTNHILLAFSGDDSSVCLWTGVVVDNKNVFFEPIHKLVGHEDWVRCLDFVQINETDLLLASASQDQFIRIWRISMRSKQEVDANKLDLFNLPDGDIQVEEDILKIQSKNEDIYFAVSIESVLAGHEGWVYGIHWNKSNDELKLLSSSIDKTLIIWKLQEDGVWMEHVRVGEVGGNSLGFYGGKFSIDGKSILGHGFHGSFHIWNQTNDDLWEPSVITGGHFNEVRDLCWEPNGQFFYTVSADQTTRIHGPWIKNGVLNDVTTWHEIARPQVHGYDMQTIAVISRYKFASGAEEKIVRTFQASTNFIENFRKICDVLKDTEGDELLETLPKGASVPSLGLSNKAVYNSDETPTEKHVKDFYPENYFVPLVSDKPPQEESLMQNTLWPEVQKLYGHGFEIFAITSSPNGKLLASSCKATTTEHAQIILWNTSTWKQSQKLSSHQLTVTQMKFSPNSKYLLSVSRDRKWTLFAKHSDSDNIDFQIVSRPKTTSECFHSRIIWSCDWSHDSKLFATSSRDGKVVIWGFNDSLDKESCSTSLGNVSSKGLIELPNESITAVAFAFNYYADKQGIYLIACGLENGTILLYKYDGNCSQICRLDKCISHHSTVKKLQFRPCKNGVLLASCGSDNFVRINEIFL